ncbi:glycoside hydrolase [Microthyrium microscopicum]|uniref:chitinase n=1 Tax=Microthyrium microscopicum TaxID=703497 RepID=A0A6A6TWU7_9PEZI|nr:glycoside hydrolase [Microthyrium microscopicum]
MRATETLFLSAVISSCSVTASFLPTSTFVVPQQSECAAIRVQPGDGCWAVANKCSPSITVEQLKEYNPKQSLCETLVAGDALCCTPGQLPDMRPKPRPDGTCYSYSVKAGDGCWDIANKAGLKVGDLDSLNKETWGWTGCSGLKPKDRICVSVGAPPLPEPIANAQCGPQKPGTTWNRHNDKSLASLNPCPLNACCTIWGQCGVTAEHCTPQGRDKCISNCGMGIVNNKQEPAKFRTVGYFNGDNIKRKCLTMNASDIDTSKYTHIHYAFGEIDPIDFNVNKTANQEQFRKFANLTNTKRIISFGGWTGSNGPDSDIIRNAISEKSRIQFAIRVAQFVLAWKLDGVDFDWEYAEATTADTANYLQFLELVRSILTPEHSVSIAVMSGYNTMKQYPMLEIARVVDYITYMAYDLHGQWGVGNKWAQSGCPSGNCLRSHLNLTETFHGLSMITKSGVPASKILVGVTSYGRSFNMAQAGCDGPMCTFTGTKDMSEAKPGNCTASRGVLAEAEIMDIARNQSRVTRHFVDAHSDILVYDKTQWVAYFGHYTKEERVANYKLLNFGGIADWSVDQQVRRPPPARVQSPATYHVKLEGAW